MTALRLAEHVAHTVDVDGMLDSMTHEQFDEWRLKDQIEPIGSEATRNILGLIGLIIAQFAGAKSIELTHFLPWLEFVDEEQSVNDMKAQMSIIPGAVHGDPR